MRNDSLFTKPPRPASPKPSRWKLARYVVGTAFRRMLTVIGAIVFFSALAGVVLTWLAVSGRVAAPLPETFVLHLPLQQDLIEHQNVESLYDFTGTGSAYTLREVIDSLDRAAQDKRVKGFVLSLEGGGLNLAQLGDLREAIKRFRKAGRFAWIYGMSYGDPGAGLGTYALAAAFDQIWLQPMGELSVAGIRAEVPFARAALDKIGVQPEFFARKEYKTLFESLTSDGFSPESREMTGSLVNNLAAQLMVAIAIDRNLQPDVVRMLVDQGIYTDQEALEAGLVTRLDDFKTLTRTLAGDVAGNPDAAPEDFLVTLADYADDIPHRPQHQKHKRVALVYITGAIQAAAEAVRAQSLYGEASAVAEDVSDAIDEAAADEGIEAIVLRIDSPGGSPVAAEAMRLAILRARDKGKKIIVSMGGEAASGGYWVAAPAERIFAAPMTLTGSIGVAGGKVALRDLWAKLGVSWDSVQAGANAGMWSMNEPFSPAGTERMNAIMDNIYDGFIARVAEGRKMTTEQADAVARGRVWTGQQALEKGLVDELGGLDAALDYTAKQLGLTDRNQLEIEVLPRPKTAFEALMEMMEGQVRAADNLKALEAAKPYLDALVQLKAQAEVGAYQPLRIVP